MKTRGAVEAALGRWPAITEMDARILVPTHCLYPSNASVTVIVEGGAEEFIVHDDGGAVDEANAAGARFQEPHKVAGYLVRPFGLAMDENGVIRSPRIPAKDLLGSIVLVANASKEVSHELVDRIKPRLRRNFRADLANLLEIKFPKLIARNVSILGASNKSHKFDLSIKLAEKRQIVIDAVMHDSSSINAAVVANLDVGRAKLEGIEQRIVYDDVEPWTSADLSLLKVGAQAVPFSRLPEVLDRLAA